MDSSAETLVGVVIPVPEPYASELAQWRASFGDPMAGVVPAHITLVTVTPPRDWGATVEHVRQVAAQQKPFRVSLAGSDSFRPVSPVVFAKVGDGFTDVVDLHQRLQTGPLESELPFPFHPHVTAAHGVATEAMDRATSELSSYIAEFDADSMGLYVHDDDGVWHLIEHVPFGGTPVDDEKGGHHSTDGQRQR